MHFRKQAIVQNFNKNFCLDRLSPDCYCCPCNIKYDKRPKPRIYIEDDQKINVCVGTLSNCQEHTTQTEKSVAEEKCDRYVETLFCKPCECAEYTKMVDDKNSIEISNINKNLETIKETLKDIQQMLSKHEEQMKMYEKRTESTNTNFGKKCQKCACLPANANVVNCSSLTPSNERKVSKGTDLSECDNSREYVVLPFQYQRQYDFLPFHWLSSFKKLPPPPLTCPVLKNLPFSQFPKEKYLLKDVPKNKNPAKTKNSVDESNLRSEIEVDTHIYKTESSDALSHIDELKRILESRRLSSAKTSTGKTLDKNEKSVSK